MKRIILTESQFSRLNENVFINKLNNKSNKAYLTYNKGIRSYGNMKNGENLKTDKMDNDNYDTYEVILKGNIKSYNITSINGTEIMHYFKRHFTKNGQTNIKIGNKDYEISMEEKNFNEFIDRFIKKVGFVIKYYLYNNKIKINKDTKIAIYPVPSSSNFNQKMAELMSNKKLANMETIIIDQRILLKDLENVSTDNDFINKNKEYFNGKISNSEIINGSVIQNINNSLNRSKAINNVSHFINKMNIYSKLITNELYSYNHANSIKKAQKMADLYMNILIHIKCALNLVYTKMK